jgi:hypothetical protein
VVPAVLAGKWSGVHYYTDLGFAFKARNAQFREKAAWCEIVALLGELHYSGGEPPLEAGGRRRRGDEVILSTGDSAPRPSPSLATLAGGGGVDGVFLFGGGRSGGRLEMGWCRF